MPDQYTSIDNSASVNLNDNDYANYLKYKKQLIDDGETFEEIEKILTGYIWDEIENYD